MIKQERNNQHSLVLIRSANLHLYDIDIDAVSLKKMLLISQTDTLTNELALFLFYHYDRF